MSSIVNTHCPHVPAAPGVVASLLVVLTADSRGVYAAYQGLVPAQASWPDGGSGWAGWVAERGTKLTYKQALAHFPQIPEGKYRG